ncbi:MAG: tRNA-(ms[2]io[6]A)-hydroxylase [Deltaproteobacteria bacterium]|nr:tRNA-(ms[2]io[6]A)-hydroxylase [Deltaproteobacteria bacterium]MBI3295643.1 tRNA-(ms[2]io[6]A)-hydroxylase [Deltaproteobacteria bacterium]
MFELRHQTPPGWVKTALQDFNAFLMDHASCERKASAVGMSFVVRYPDRQAILEPMINFAREELEHFHQVYRLIAARGLTLAPDEQDAYVNLLMDQVRHGREERFLDRLLLASVIEARGFERICLVADELTDPSLKTLYTRLGRAEGAHKILFLELAALYFPIPIIKARLSQLLDFEAEAIQKVPFRSALH